jgi:hypothetical protein
MRKVVSVLSLAAVAGSILVAMPGSAAAQTVIPVEPTAKGIVGCGLLGAETVMLIEAAAGARPTWAYIVGGTLGAAAGAVGGYFLEEAAVGDNTLTGIAVGSLVLGLGLSIPTVVAVRGATRYNPERDQASDDNAPGTGPLDEGTSRPASGDGAAQPAPASSPAPAANPSTSRATDSADDRAPRLAARPAVRHHTTLRGAAPSVLRPTGLLDLNPAGFSLAVPSVSVGNAVTVQEMRQYGATPVSEVRIPLLSGSF